MTSPDHPWNVLPFLPKGDDDVATIFQAVGGALTAWEGFEGNLAFTFAVLCDARLPGAVRAYGTITAFGGRRDMVAAAFGVYPHRRDEQLAGFPKFLDHAQKFASRRNEIAHGRVVKISPSIGASPEGCYLAPAEYNTNKRYRDWELADGVVHDVFEFSKRAVGKYAYTSAQIDFYTGYFRRLMDEARTYALAFRERLAN